MRHVVPRFNYKMNELIIKSNDIQNKQYIYFHIICMNTPAWSQYLRLFADMGADAFQHVQPKHAVRKFCVIVEPRQHPNLIPVIKNFMFLLQHTGWGLIVYHGPDNERFVKDGLRDAISDDCVHYVRMIPRNLTTGEYSAMLGDPLFWQCLLDGFKCEHALIFQCDTLLLKGGDAIDAFLKYDYVGAPWPDPGMRATIANRSLQFRVGNGGLSLRNVRVMLAITRRHPYPYNHEMSIPEDVYFAYWLKANEEVYWTPSSEEASAFAMEHVYNPDAAGLHAPSPEFNEECGAMIQAARTRRH
jgi:hypothetical protein